MAECLHVFCDTKIKKKIFYCEKKVNLETLQCKKCNGKEDLVVCLHSMNVYCKNERHYTDKAHILFYEIQNKTLVCTFCDKQTIVKFARKKKGDCVEDGCLYVKYVELPKFPHRVLEQNVIKGFQNLGNTCYINSLFHILLNINKFKKGIITEDHPIRTCGTCLICNIKQIIKHVHNDKDFTFKELINCIMNFSSEYRNDDQHDIHTFYLNVVENIQKHTKKEFENSFIDKLFYGNINSTLRCLRCSFKRHTIEAFCSISLNHTNTLKESLAEYFLDEHMEDKLHCLNCKERTVFSKSLEIIQVPEILVIHIMRFEFVNTVTKINNRIEIDQKISLGGNEYTLKGFVQHRGSIEHGHYLSYIRLGDVWYEFDDNTVRKMLLRNVPFQDAYLLFYVIDRNKDKV